MIGIDVASDIASLLYLRAWKSLCEKPKRLRFANEAMEIDTFGKSFATFATYLL